MGRKGGKGRKGRRDGMDLIGSGGGGFVVDLGTLVVVALVIVVALAFGVWMVFRK